MRVVATDGREYAAKTCSGPQPGLAVAALLAGRGVAGVPGPLRTADGRLASVTDGVDGPAGGRLSLVPWVPGQRVLDVGMAPRAWGLLGELLGRLHSTMPAAPALTGVPVEDHAQGDVVEQARAVGDVVEKALRAHPGDPVVDEGGQVWLVDWDDAVIAPREADLMFVVGGVFSHAPVTDEQVQWFFDGYTPLTGLVRADLDPDLMTYLRCVRALVDVLDLIAVAVDVAGDDEASRRAALGHARRTFGPHGLVTLALG